MPRPPLLNCFAIVVPGLEAFAIAEARALGLKVEPEPGGFAWTGTAESAMVANVGLRIASRILVRLASFEARSFAELERHARKVEWSRVISPGDAARFRVTCKKSKLYHSDAVAQRLADALKRAVPGARVEGGSVADEEADDASEDAALIVVRIMRDRCTVSGDSSGALLHRRGYRLASTKAPLRETIAAGMLAASGWDGVSPLVDPLCGSGTIPIEAALQARRVAPGARRSFAMERWPTVPTGLGERVREAFAGEEVAGSGATIMASDRDSGAIASSRANAERAGVRDDIQLAIHSLSAAPFAAAASGWVVTNPPYGVRVGDSERVRDLWAQLGNVLRDRASGWRLALLSPDVALERQLRIPLRAAAALSNGGIPVRIMVGEIR
ncbi:MAG: class I SAM-dependent RNA methyltransferase [Gemmatimonadota bacterium]|nr:class I SAM-dependent RNA methyltransferase [Gemmatimonadota bacterium]